MKTKTSYLSKDWGWRKIQWFDSFLTEVSIFALYICFANQWTGFYMIGTSVEKELRGERKVQGSQQSLYFNFPWAFHEFLFSCTFSLNEKDICFSLIIGRIFDGKMSFYKLFHWDFLKRKTKFILTSAMLYGNNF